MASSSEEFVVVRKASAEEKPSVISSLLDKVKGFFTNSSTEEKAIIENAPTKDKLENILALEATVDEVDFLGVTCTSVNYHAKVSVKNPYSVPIPICEISYILKSSTRSRPIASGTITNPGSSVGSGITVLKIPFKVLHGFVISGQLQNLPLDIDYQLEIGLTLDLPDVGNITIPISTQGEIKFSSGLAITMIK